MRKEIEQLIALRQGEAGVGSWDIGYESGRKVIIKVGVTQPKGARHALEMFNSHERHTMRGI